MTQDNPTPEFDATAQGQAVANEAAVSQADARLQELEAKHSELSDAFLRAKAEAENARRRADEEVAKARKYAVEGFADSLLPV